MKEAPVEMRCGGPRRIVAYLSNRRPDRSSLCVDVRGRTDNENPVARAAQATHAVRTLRGSLVRVGAGLRAAACALAPWS